MIKTQTTVKKRWRTVLGLPAPPGFSNNISNFFSNWKLKKEMIEFYEGDKRIVTIRLRGMITPSHRKQMRHWWRGWAGPPARSPSSPRGEMPRFGEGSSEQPTGGVTHKTASIRLNRRRWRAVPESRERENNCSSRERILRLLYRARNGSIWEFSRGPVRVGLKRFCF